VKQKKNRNPLPKTARGKKRYLVCRFFSNASLDSKAVFSSLNELFFSLFGSVGVANQKVVWREFDPKKGLLLVQCNALHESEVAAGLLMVRKIGLQEAIPSLVLKSGSLQKALDKAGFEEKKQ
jgi:RNase P/RNase MRP subunit POP5